MQNLRHARDDAIECFFAPIDKIHLVHGEHEVRYAEQCGNRHVTTCLFHDAVARIDKHDGDVTDRG